MLFHTDGICKKIWWSPYLTFYYYNPLVQWNYLLTKTKMLMLVYKFTGLRFEGEVRWTQLIKMFLHLILSRNQ